MAEYHINLADYASLGWGNYAANPRIYWGSSRRTASNVAQAMCLIAEIGAIQRSYIHYRSSGTLIRQEVGATCPSSGRPIDYNTTQNRSHFVLPFNTLPDDQHYAFTRQILGIPPPGQLFTYAELQAIGHQYWQTDIYRPDQVDPTIVWPADQNIGSKPVVVSDAWTYGRYSPIGAIPNVSERISEGLAASILTGLNADLFGFLRHEATADFLTSRYSAPNLFSSADFAVPFATHAMYLIFHLDLPFAFNRVFDIGELAEAPHSWILISQDVTA